MGGGEKILVAMDGGQICGRYDNQVWADIYEAGKMCGTKTEERGRGEWGQLELCCKMWWN